MSETGFVAVVTDVEHVVDVCDVVLQAVGHVLVAEEILLQADQRLGSPELQALVPVVEHGVHAAGDRDDAVVDVRVVPHERGLEVVVVAVAMHRLDGRHLEEEAGQRVQQVVVEENGLEIRAEDERVGQGVHLQLVVGQRQALQLGHAANVGRNVVQTVVLQG